MQIRQKLFVSAKGYFRFERVSGGINALDGLRALAVILVLARHAVFPTSSANDSPLWGVGDYDLATPLINGWMGVDLFFVLSGFLIGGHLMRQNADTFRWRNYLTQRALRIVPTYWFVLALVVAGIIPHYAIQDQFVLLRVSYHLLFLQDYLPPNIVVAFWSLGVEEKFYLLAPFLVLGLSRVGHARSRITLLLWVVVLAGFSRGLLALRTPDPMTYVDFVTGFRFPFHHCIDTLVIGVIAAVLYGKLHSTRELQTRLGNVLAWGGLSLVVWLLCGGELLRTIDWWDKTFQPTLIGLAFGALVLGCALNGGPHRLLSCWALRMTARLSYPLYLIHMALIPLCWHLIRAEPADATALPTFIPLFVVVSFLAAAAIHFAVEKPFLLMKNKLQENGHIGTTEQRASA